MKGRFVVVTGPSASGKSSLVDALLACTPNASRLITITTRSPRPGERDGDHYHFVAREEFTARLSKDEFFEHAEVYGNLYGSSKNVLAQLLERFAYVFAVLDVQGAKTLKDKMPHTFIIFLHPGSIENITHRLMKERVGAPAEEIQKRIVTATKELALADSFDVVVENKEGDFVNTLTNVKALIGAQLTL
ncbi:MAG: guanylate kinase [Candidatus Taylorbacteria bacterium RIFCSPHIGHO2_02_FULL_46_13]|uniref:Guanylate kinase n=1 Tax=Candidatus Taylorbacteria bacterium RIFCSPHIGHO2_02_FULL_46_13 TaxID=1802312 RepID=A0A1G2MT44_9BACT|nr:MAG: guanylate kinase [Candidatus Taylorbacteria bacterium RIFCSPHIGHO2_02_FULL_46_13]